MSSRTNVRDLPIVRMYERLLRLYSTNTHGNVMYVGITNNLERRLSEHRSGLITGFSKKYNLHKLVYFEQTPSVEAAIAREKEIKTWRREKKDKLIECVNPDFKDLASCLEIPHIRSG